MPDGRDSTRLSLNTRLGAFKNEDKKPEDLPRLYSGAQFCLFDEDLLLPALELHEGRGSDSVDYRFNLTFFPSF